MNTKHVLVINLWINYAFSHAVFCLIFVLYLPHTCLLYMEALHSSKLNYQHFFSLVSLNQSRRNKNTNKGRKLNFSTKLIYSTLSKKTLIKNEMNKNTMEIMFLRKLRNEQQQNEGTTFFTTRY